MSAVINGKTSAGGAVALEWLPVLIGLAVLYVPTFYGLAAWHWQSDEGAHGPIVLAVAAWLIWRKRAVLVNAPARTAPVAGFAFLICGLLVYVLGRTPGIALFEVGALVPILAGVVLAMRGWSALRALWFPALFMLFMVPLPGIFVDALTGPLKQLVSEIAERLLHFAGYPVARSGVLITIGQYQLLVADACAGLNSMVSLSALGLLFMYLIARKSALHNAIVLGSILPIAFLANVIRVVLLMLITYHLGDAAGQGFLHGGTGIVLLLIALISLMALDSVLLRVLRSPRRT
jgi:exosortase B